MTNEEKAVELAIKYCKEIDPHGKEVYNIGCSIACCEMAEWKEQQMIEKACLIYQNELKQFAQLLKIVSKKNTSGLIDIEKSVEEFRKAMEE